MPYIKDELRQPLLDGDVAPKNAGELNFLFTDTIRQYVRANGKSYQTCNDVVGALVCAGLEFYRRIVAPYEDTKIKENGDVY